MTLSLKGGGGQLTDDGHPFSVTVEIQDSEDIVSSFNPHFTYSDGVLRS